MLACINSDAPQRVSRRQVLRLGAAGSLSQIFAGSLLEPAFGAHDASRVVNCIFIMNSGGMSHLDLWDPKPETPAEIRGEFSPIATTVPGVFISELLPETAVHAERFAIVRGMSHDVFDHIPAARLSRAGLVTALAGANDERMCEVGPLTDDGDWETARPNYGDTRVGRHCFDACRRIEAGCRAIWIDNGHWDTHSRNAWCLKNVLAPQFDRAFAGLLADLADRGLLESTRVVVATEFGRSPAINARGGRDHWPSAFSWVVAGGPRGGQFIGETDRNGAQVIERSIAPERFMSNVR